MERLSEQARKLSLPKNKLMEKALVLYLDHLKRDEYIKSHKNTSEDEDILLVAEEGMAEYLQQLEK
jgi:hypothetical protein